MSLTRNLAFLTNKLRFDPEAAKKKSNTWSVVIDVIIVFFLVTLIAVSLRLIYDAFFTKASIFSMINEASAADPIMTAEIVKQSHSYVNIKPLAGFTFTLQYKNTGDITWTKKHVYLKSLTTALTFRHEYWPDAYLPATLQEDEVAPGEIGTFVFALLAPKNYNEYTGDFVLVEDNVMIAGGDIKVTMNVVEDPSKVAAPVAVVPPTTPDIATPPSDLGVCTLNFRMANLIDSNDAIDNSSCQATFNLPADGPLMRVGIYHTDNFISVKNTQAWQVYDQNNILLASVPAETEISFYYNNDKAIYSFDFIDHTVKTSSFLSLKNNNGGYFTLTNYHDIPSYNKNIDYNDFLGDLEIRHNDSKDRTWVIEILPMETYLKGITETTNYDPIEYLKTMSVAARTYAAYHYDRNSKHADEFFQVDATYDQVYRGYVTMLLFPRIGEAVDATKGVVATYDNKVIVAAYFSHSDGRTRSFAEVWGNDVPYLISKPTPYTEGMEMFGHGVGIDAYDAKARAKNDGWTYDQLLKYYYTGIQLEKIW
jgi:hypothetical protein